MLGGAVTGGTLYGTVPVAGTNTQGLTLLDPTSGLSLDVGQGRLLPRVATDVYAATLVRWMGVTQASELASVFAIVRGAAVLLGIAARRAGLVGARVHVVRDLVEVTIRGPDGLRLRRLAEADVRGAEEGADLGVAHASPEAGASREAEAHGPEANGPEAE